MTFDSKAYDSNVLKPLTKDKSALAEIQRAIRELQESSGVSALAGVDLPKLLAIPDDRADLAAHFAAVEMALNKRQSMSAALLLKKLIAELGAVLTDAAFWDKFESAKNERFKAKVHEFAAAVAMDYQALKVITEQHLEEKAKSQGLVGVVAASELAAAVQKAGVAVRPDFELPQIAVPRVVGDLAKHPEYRSIVDVLLLNEAQRPTSIRVIDVLQYGSGAAITAAKIDAAYKASASGKDSDALQAAQKALTLVRSDFADPVKLQQLVFATFVAAAKDMLARGELLASALAKLSNDTGLDAVDAARLLSKLSGSTSTRGLNDVTNLLAEGALADARRTFDAVADPKQFSEAEIQRIEGLLATAEQRKAALFAEYEAALSSRDFGTAATALGQAANIDRQDARLQSLLDALPPPPPEHLVAKMSADEGVSLSWSHPAREGTRFIIVRNTDGHAPANTADGTQLARDLSATTYVDAKPSVAQRSYYSVFAERRGVSSLPASAAQIVLPRPLDVSANASLTDVTVMWRLVPQAVGVRITRIGPDGRSTPVDVQGATRTTVRGLTTGSRYRFTLEAVYVLADGTRMTSAPNVVDATPRAAISAVTDLVVGDTRLPDGRDGHRATWSEPVGFAVELWSFPIDETLPVVGAEISLDDLDALDGKRVNGVLDAETGRAGMTFPKMRELRTVAAITVDGRRGLFGSSVIVGSAPSVKDLRVDRFADAIVVSWEWPHGDYAAAVTWSRGSVKETRRCSRAEYKAEGGVRIPRAEAVDRVSVATVAYGNGAEWVAQPVEIQLAAQLPTVRYELDIPASRFGRRKPASAVVHGDGYSGPLALVVVARTSSIMPSRADDGDVIARLNIDVNGTAPTATEFSVPKLSSPFWIRLFLDGDAAVKLQDPPTNQLKG